MTKSEAFQAIEMESRTTTWFHASTELRLHIIAGFINAIDEEPEQAAKKVVKVRKTRKQKTAPLTQHAAGNQEGE